jgi:hypothetical protein
MPHNALMSCTFLKIVHPCPAYSYIYHIDENSNITLLITLIKHVHFLKTVLGYKRGSIGKNIKPKKY